MTTNKKYLIIILVTVLFFISGGLAYYLRSTSLNQQSLVNLTSAEMAKWQGRWYQTPYDQFWTGELYIGTTSPSQFEFEFSGVTGGHMGEIGRGDNGKYPVAKFVSANQAIYVDTDESLPEAERCRITFDLSDADLKWTTENCSYFGGAAYVFPEQFSREKIVKQKTLVDLGIFSQTGDANFIKVVGADYEEFVPQYLIAEGESNNNLDGFAAKIYEGVMVGSSYDSLFLVTPDEHFAAIFSYFHDESVYYSNISGFEHKLPPTIDQWLKSDEYRTDLHVQFGVDKNQ